MAQGAHHQNQHHGDTEELCKGIFQNRSQSEAEFFRMFRPPAIRWAKQKVSNPFDAEDLAHDALVTVLMRLRSRPLNNPSNLRGYVRRTVDFTAIGFLRKQARRKTDTLSETLDDLHAIGDTAFRSAALFQDCQRVRELLNRLSQPRDRELLRMQFLQEQTKPEICQLLSVTPAQLDRILYRAKNRLRSVIESCKNEASLNLNF